MVDTRFRYKSVIVLKDFWRIQEIQLKTVNGFGVSGRAFPAEILP